MDLKTYGLRDAVIDSDPQGTRNKLDREYPVKKKKPLKRKPKGEQK